MQRQAQGNDRGIGRIEPVPEEFSNERIAARHVIARAQRKAPPKVGESGCWIYRHRERHTQVCIDFAVFIKIIILGAQQS